MTCQEHHKPLRYETEVSTVQMNHPFIRIRNGHPEAQAYLVEPDRSSEVIEGREDELQQVTSGSASSIMVSGILVEAGSSEGATQARERSW